jgi:hypothetical protein
MQISRVILSVAALAIAGPVVAIAAPIPAVRTTICLALFEGADHFGVVMPALPTMRAIWQHLFGTAPQTNNK